MTFPNEIEKTKAEIKVLEAKLSLLEEMERHKTPCEVAFKSVYGYCPTEAKWNADKLIWQSFQKGYNAAKEEKGSEYQPTPQTPEQVAEGLRDAMKTAKAEGVIDEPKPEPETLKQLLNRWGSDFSAEWGNPEKQNREFYEEDVDRFIQMFIEWLPAELAALYDDWDDGYNSYRNAVVEKLK